LRSSFERVVESTVKVRRTTHQVRKLYFWSVL